MALQYQQKSDEALQYLPEQQNKWVIPAISAALSALSSLSSGSSARKASNVKTPQVDLNALNNLINQQAEQNARRSLALEAELTPENQALRRTSTTNLLNRAQGGDVYGDTALQAALSELRRISDPSAGEAMRAPLLESAIRTAGEDLAQGGRLDAETRNETTRRAAANAAKVGGGRLGLGRYLAPRDLGLTSMQVRENRLNRASQLGQVESQYNAGRFTGLAQLRQLLSQSLGGQANQRFGQDLATASFGSSLTPPTVGLSPESAADVSIGNQQNRYAGQQQQIGLRNQANQNNLQGLAALLSIFNK